MNLGGDHWFKKAKRMIYMDKILVIGAGGLVGGKIIEFAKGKYEVFGTYNTSIIEGSNYFKLDVMNREEVLRIVNEVKPKLIVDTHAFHNVDKCETEKDNAWNVNVNGTRNVAEAAQSVGAKYVYFSTDYVFDGSKSIYTEEDQPNPLSYYAKTKYAAELVLKALVEDYIIIRPSVIYGVGGKGKVSFALWLIDKLRKGENVNIVSDQYNNPTLVDNLAEITLKLYEVDAKGIFHVTSKTCVNRYDFSLMVATVFNLNKDLIKPVTTAELKQVAKRAERVNMDTHKAEHITGIKTLTIEESLRILKSQMGA